MRLSMGCVGINGFDNLACRNDCGIRRLLEGYCLGFCARFAAIELTDRRPFLVDLESLLYLSA